MIISDETPGFHQLLAHVTYIILRHFERCGRPRTWPSAIEVPMCPGSDDGNADVRRIGPEVSNQCFSETFDSKLSAQ